MHRFAESEKRNQDLEIENKLKDSQASKLVERHKEEIRSLTVKHESLMGANSEPLLAEIANVSNSKFHPTPFH